MLNTRHTKMNESHPDKFAVFDIDGTLIRWQLYHVIVNKLAKAGVLGKDAYPILRQAMMAWKRREKDDAYKAYERELVEIYEKALPNITTDVFDALVKEITEEYVEQTYIYTRRLIKKLKTDGYKLFIISGSHIELIGPLARFYGFDDWMGIQYERSGNTFTGKVQISTLNKEKSLKILLERNNVTLKDSVGVGDTAGDIPMLEAVENAIVFNPDKKLLAAAKQNRWKIVIERKSIIYELEPMDGTYVLAETAA